MRPSNPLCAIGTVVRLRSNRMVDITLADGCGAFCHRSDLRGDPAKGDLVSCTLHSRPRFVGDARARRATRLGAMPHGAAVRAVLDQLHAIRISEKRKAALYAALPEQIRTTVAQVRHYTLLPQDGCAEALERALSRLQPGDVDRFRALLSGYPAHRRLPAVLFQGDRSTVPPPLWASAPASMVSAPAAAAAADALSPLGIPRHTLREQLGEADRRLIVGWMASSRQGQDRMRFARVAELAMIHFLKTNAPGTVEDTSIRYDQPSTAGLGAPRDLRWQTHDIEHHVPGQSVTYIDVKSAIRKTPGRIPSLCLKAHKRVGDREVRIAGVLGDGQMAWVLGQTSAAELAALHSRTGRLKVQIRPPVKWFRLPAWVFATQRPVPGPWAARLRAAGPEVYARRHQDWLAPLMAEADALAHAPHPLRALLSPPLTLPTLYLAIMDAFFLALGTGQTWHTTQLRRLFPRINGRSLTGLPLGIRDPAKCIDTLLSALSTLAEHKDLWLPRLGRAWTIEVSDGHFVQARDQGGSVWRLVARCGRPSEWSQEDNKGRPACGAWPLLPRSRSSWCSHGYLICHVQGCGYCCRAHAA